MGFFQCGDNISWQIDNTGSIPGYVDLEAISVVNAENYDPDTNDAEALADSDTSDATGGGELGADMTIVLFWDDGSGGGTANNGLQDGSEATIYSGDLDSLASSITEQNYLLGADSTSYICLNWSISSEVGNEIMGDSATLDFSVELGQTPGQ